MKKRLLALLLALTMTAALAACKSDKELAERPADDESAVTVPAGDGGETPEDTDPTGSAGAPDSTQEPAPPSETVDLAAFYETLSAGEDWPAMMQAEGEVLDAFYPGLSDIDAAQCAVYTAMISATVGEIALVEVRNAGDVQRVKDIFQARIDYQVGDDETPGGAWYPQTIEGWKNDVRIVSNGNYVMLAAISEKSDDVVAAFNALFDAGKDGLS